MVSDRTRGLGRDRTTILVLILILVQTCEPISNGDRGIGMDLGPIRRRQAKDDTTRSTITWILFALFLLFTLVVGIIWFFFFRDRSQHHAKDPHQGPGKREEPMRLHPVTKTKTQLVLPKVKEERKRSPPPAAAPTVDIDTEDTRAMVRQALK